MKIKISPVSATCLMILSLLTWGSVCAAQSIDKLKQQSMNRKKITLSQGDSVEVFQIKAGKSGHGFKDMESVYTWYGANRLHNTRGAVGGNVLEGEYSRFNKGKALLERGEYRKGKKEGRWVQWYGNGSLMHKDHWKNGVRDGKFESFYPDGSVYREGRFRDGKLQGTIIRYDTQGLKTKQRYKQGVLKERKPKKITEKENSSTELKSSVVLRSLQQNGEKLRKSMKRRLEDSKQKRRAKREARKGKIKSKQSQ